MSMIDHENEEFVTLAHGGGGRAYHALVERVFVPAFDNSLLRELNDSALCPLNGESVALTTDSFVVRPRFFPGGDLGRLAVCGTVNDLAMSGAKPLYLTCGMILEAGLPLAELRQISASMAAAAVEAGVRIVTGDTKVVEKGACDGLYINTAGIGVFSAARPALSQRVAAGDLILLSGNMGDHGLAVMAAREGLAFTPPLASDAAPLNGLVEALRAGLGTAGAALHALRDATRGGVGAVAAEWAAAGRLDIELWEERLPVHPHVRAAADLLGLDPLFAANEGKFLAAVAPAQAEAAVAALRSHPLGRDAAIIGQVATGNGRLLLRTAYGTRRLVELPEGELLPRIC